VAAQARCKGGAECRSSRAGLARRPRVRFCADTIVEHWTEASDEVPRCAGCGALLRPDVVWFEETLPAEALQAAEDAARRCQVLLVVGTSAEVYPAAALPAYATSAGATIVEINPNPTPLSGAADYVLRAPAGVVLPALVAAAWPV
jgi:NAD-dependent deacetylase